MKHNIQNSTIIIVDDYTMMRNGLMGYTKWKITGLADSIEQAKNLVAEQLPEIVIIDVQLGDEDSFELLEYLTKKAPKIKCVMYSMFDTS